MKTVNGEKERKHKKERILFIIAMLLIMAVTLVIILFWPLGRNKKQESEQQQDADISEEATATEAVPSEAEVNKTGLANESARDGEIDFAAIQQENPDIFAWIYIPDTNIDYPVLQSEEADDYYENHNADGTNGSEGAVYTELANLKNMCDFNTVLHGKAITENGEAGLFAEISQFANPEFFEKHNSLYLYLPGNVLTYEIFTAYEREDTSLIRTYDFTYMSGCQQFLDDMYNTRDMGKNIREGWEAITPYHFLLTLTTKTKPDSDRQYVVIGAMVGDAAGVIDRIVED